MEFEFRTKLQDSRDVDFYNFTSIVDKDHDYANDIDILIEWSAVVYAKECCGITDIFPSIQKVSLDYDYNFIEEISTDVSDWKEGERNYKLEIDDFLDYPLSDNEQRERAEKSLSEKKWVMRTEYTPSDEGTKPDLVLTSIEIDWKNKEVTITF
tara:strand:+ start:534 stop:995 length:462 start_codon:yes stop_codon:yes gene_type:complete